MAPDSMSASSQLVRALFGGGDLHILSPRCAVDTLEWLAPSACAHDLPEPERVAHDVSEGNGERRLVISGALAA